MNRKSLCIPSLCFAPPSLSPALKGGDGGAILTQLIEKETENLPPFRVGEMQIFSFGVAGQRAGRL
jgi:hypothetical protein